MTDTEQTDAKWTPANWPSTDYHGESLDLTVKAGGRFSMRRHGDLVSVAATTSETTHALAALALTPDEVLTIATSLLAAYRLSTTGPDAVPVPADVAA